MNRTIATTTQHASLQITDLLQSALVAELLDPSPHVWLVSAWIGDPPVIDNRAGQFTSLIPSWTERRLLLSDVLAELLASGSQVTVATNQDASNRGFRTALEERAAALDADRKLTVSPLQRLDAEQERTLHRKRLVTGRFVWWGSMNFTRSGISRNSEDVAFETESQQVARAINEMEQLYPSTRP